MKILLLPWLFVAASSAGADNLCSDPAVHCVRGEPVTQIVGTADANLRSTPAPAVDSRGLAHAAGEVAAQHAPALEPAPAYSAYPLVRQTTLDATGGLKACVRASTSMRCLPADPNRAR